MPPSPSILSPADLSLPAKFSTWRPGQWECVETAVETDRRFIACSIPTGGGKSLFNVGAASLIGGRSCYVTSSKGLQDQLKQDFSDYGLFDIRGRKNYPCVRGNGATCAEGAIFDCKDDRCRYRNARAEFLESQSTSTNYAYLLSSTIHSEGVGKVNCLMLDEAHNCLSELSSAIEIHLPHYLYKFIYTELGTEHPVKKPLSEWRTWAKFLHPEAQKVLANMKASNSHKFLGLVSEFTSTIERISTVSESWILDESNSGETIIAPLWPTEYAEKYLFQSIPHIILSSATLVPKTLSLLGISEADSVFLTQDHTFDPRRSPVYLFGDSRVDHKQSEGDWQSTVARMDRFITNRLDRKGMIHPVSYDRQERILRDSEHRSIMIAPRRPSEFAEAVEQFRKSKPPRILISPAATTGYDFPGSQCEYSIMLKMPFVDGRSPIMKARSEQDKEYLNYLTAQTLVQTCGRGMRGPMDQCENVILDAHARWFFNKPDRGGYRHLVPSWFLKQLQYIDRQPTPLPALRSP